MRGQRGKGREGYRKKVGEEINQKKEFMKMPKGNVLLRKLIFKVQFHLILMLRVWVLVSMCVCAPLQMERLLFQSTPDKCLLLVSLGLVEMFAPFNTDLL